MMHKTGYGKFKDAYSGAVPLTERRAGYAICRTTGRCSKKEISKALWFSARKGREVTGTHTYLGGYMSINSQQVIDCKCRTLTMCSSEHWPIRLVGRSSRGYVAKESRRSGP